MGYTIIHMQHWKKHLQQEKKEGEALNSLQRLMDVSMAVVQELQYVQKQSLIQSLDFMMTRRDFLCWKEMALSDLIMKSLRLKRGIHS